MKNQTIFFIACIFVSLSYAMCMQTSPGISLYQSDLNLYTDQEALTIIAQTAAVYAALQGEPDGKHLRPAVGYFKAVCSGSFVRVTDRNKDFCNIMLEQKFGTITNQTLATDECTCLLAELVIDIVAETPADTPDRMNVIYTKLKAHPMVEETEVQESEL